MSEVDRLTVIRHRRCENCGFVDPAPGMSHPEAGHATARCHGPVVEVEYVPAEQLRGAVEALVLARNELHRACLGLKSTEGFNGTFETLNVAIRVSRGGQ